MKKHELIKKAYDTLPTGTEFISKLGTKGISEGCFEIVADVVFHIGKNSRLIVADNTGWATIIPASILTGKCAVQVSNAREFKLLMEHYEAKGWVWNITGGRAMPFNLEFPYSISYESNFTWSKMHNAFGTKVIPFDKFAAEIGIEVPVFVMTSEDGVPIYFGDKIYRSYWDTHDKKWSIDDCILRSKSNAVITGVDKAKAFSTKEAAEAWCKEKNKPKSIWIDYGRNATALVLKELVQFHLIDGLQFELTKDQLAEINSKMAQLEGVAP